MLEQTKRISFRFSSVLSKVAPAPTKCSGSNRLRLCNTAHNHSSHPTPQPPPATTHHTKPHTLYLVSRLLSPDSRHPSPISPSLVSFITPSPLYTTPFETPIAGGRGGR